MRFDFEGQTYSLRFYHSHHKKSGRLKATSAVLELPDGTTVERIVRPYVHDKLSKALGRRYAFKALALALQDYPRALRRRLGEVYHSLSA
jgi:hypothetical protein